MRLPLVDIVFRELEVRCAESPPISFAKSMLDQSDLDLVMSAIGAEPTPPEAGLLGPTSSSVWIGSGLAKIPALYGAAVLQKTTGAPSRFMTALEYVRNPLVRSLPILVSLRGNHMDAVAVAESIVARRQEKAILLTGDPDGGAASILRSVSETYDLMSSPLPARDRRFVNCKGIFMLSLLSYRLTRGASSHLDAAQLRRRAVEEAWVRARKCAARFGEWLRRSGVDVTGPLIVLSDGMPSELSLTWQAVLSEAGVATPVCLDIKDYTHGDHAAASRIGNARYIVLSHAAIKDLCLRFTERFSSLYDVFEVDLSADPAHVFWENLFTVCNVTSIWTSLLGYPGRRPVKHPVVSTWRDWGDLFPDRAADHA